MKNSGDNVFQGIPVAEPVPGLFATFLAAHDFSSHTRKALANDLRKFAGANKEPFSLGRVTMRDAIDFREWLRRDQGQAVVSINRALVSIRRFFGWLADQGHVAATPANAVKELRRIQLAPKGMDRAQVRWREVVASDARLAYSGACYFLDVFLGVVLTAEKDSTAAASRAAAWDWSGYRTKEWHRFLLLLRHVMGNPFIPFHAPDHWLAPIVHLASALYDGQDCRFALSNALFEAGQVELAEHFRRGDTHPKGCWAMDLILGKS